MCSKVRAAARPLTCRREPEILKVTPWFPLSLSLSLSVPVASFPSMPRWAANPATRTALSLGYLERCRCRIFRSTSRGGISIFWVRVSAVQRKAITRAYVLLCPLVAQQLRESAGCDDRLRHSGYENKSFSFFFNKWRLGSRLYFARLVHLIPYYKELIACN